MESTRTVPLRSELDPADCWDLSSLFVDDQAWEEAFTAWQGRIPQYARFAGRLGEGPEVLAEALEFHIQMERSGERLGVYAFLKSAEDTTNGVYHRMHGR